MRAAIEPRQSERKGSRRTKRRNEARSTNGARESFGCGLRPGSVASKVMSVDILSACGNPKAALSSQFLLEPSPYKSAQASKGEAGARWVPIFGNLVPLKGGLQPSQVSPFEHAGAVQPWAECTIR